ncbi:MAG: uncharacterized protein K0R90_1425 [Oscillospiraceae bacterium]|nr:uncharacterized protein [Oscillospiraceae bacterium]
MAIQAIQKAQNPVLSVQQLINIKDIKGSCLYTKDSLLFSYLKVQPISTGLMSKDEKARMVRNMTQEISPLNVPFKITLLSRPTDVKQVVNFYENIKQMTPQSNKRDSITKTVRYLSESSQTGGVLERQTFLSAYIPASNHTDVDMLQIITQFKNALEHCNIRCDILDEKSIVQMCALFLNPNYSNTFVSEYDNNFTILLEGDANG